MRNVGYLTWSYYIGVRAGQASRRRVRLVRRSGSHARSGRPIRSSPAEPVSAFEDGCDLPVKVTAEDRGDAKRWLDEWVKIVNGDRAAHA